jgi:Domain of unknown function (DUF4260)
LPGSGHARLAPTVLLRAEGAGLAVVALVAYALVGAGWWLFAALLLAPDLSMLGYLAGPRVGARIYNAAHTTLGPLALGVVGVLAGHEVALSLSLIWLAHIGFDRAIGYGLKYPDRFQHTHLGTIGRR